MKLHQLAAVWRGRRRAAAATAVTLAAAATLNIAPTDSHAGEAAADVSSIVLQPGSDQTARIVSWYATTAGAQGVQLAPSSEVTSGQFPTTAVTIPGTVATNASAAASGHAGAATAADNGYAVLPNLKENTQYSYRVGSDSHWSATYTFSTGAFSGAYDFLFFGDPQIGSSGDPVLDGQGWGHTLDVADRLDPQAELLVSGGDQVNTANYENEWDAFLRPGQLRSKPWLATIGNHDVGSKNYEQHFHMPNLDSSWQYYSGGKPSAPTSGGDYWLIYKNVLFIDINSNSYAVSSASGTGDAAHLNYVADVIDQHGAEAKWTVLVYHHAIYSPADHANDADNAKRRADFPRAFSRLGVDLVLQGHDHSYSRSYLINRGAKANAAEQPGAPEVVKGPGGVLYVTSNSASGSKYYDLTEPNTSANNGDFGPDPLDDGSDGHVNHWANSVENQENVPAYVKIGVSDKALKVTNVRSGDCDGSTPNAAVQRHNVAWCGTKENVTTLVDPADATKGYAGRKNKMGAEGSLVDSVTLHRALTVPAAAGISGTAQVGETLTAPTYTWSQPGTTQSYVWKADGAVFGGDTASATLGAAQLGKAITVDVTGNNSLYDSASVTSPATAKVVAAPPIVLTASAPAAISGTSQVGQTLTAPAYTWSQPGTTQSYVWTADGVVFGGDTAAVTLDAAQLGKTVTVQVTGSKPGFQSATVTSLATGAVAAAPPKVLTASSSAPIYGTARVGGTLTAPTYTWSQSDATQSYVWKADGVAFGTDTASVTLDATQLGKAITVEVTGTKPGFEAATVTSAATTPIAAGTLVAATPRITGAAKVGKPLTAVPGAWTAGSTLAYQWLADGAVVKGATTTTFKPTTAQVGKRISVKVTGSKTGYTGETRTSVATAKVVK